ncbi:MAG: hypothetical protein N2Z22_02640 [Turneriella sp.]|nr:hypothetical protein [Turneriella sp.]
MPLRFYYWLPLAIAGCTAVKYNSHVGPDGGGGYLRTYYSSEKYRVHHQGEGTGIEQCKIQGSDIVCRDLNILIELDTTPKPEAAPSAPAAKTPPAKQPAKAAAKTR